MAPWYQAGATASLTTSTNERPVRCRSRRGAQGRPRRSASNTLPFGSLSNCQQRRSRQRTSRASSRGSSRRSRCHKAIEGLASNTSCSSSQGWRRGFRQGCQGIRLLRALAIASTVAATSSTQAGPSSFQRLRGARARPSWRGRRSRAESAMPTRGAAPLPEFSAVSGASRASSGAGGAGGEGVAGGGVEADDAAPCGSASMSKPARSGIVGPVSPLPGSAPEVVPRAGCILGSSAASVCASHSQSLISAAVQPRRPRTLTSAGQCSRAAGCWFTTPRRLNPAEAPVRH